MLLASAMSDVISAIVLAGGQGRRVGGVDKGWLDYGGRPMIEHILARLKPQVDDVVISCNRNLPRYAALAPVIEDQYRGYLGPLAGISAAAGMCRHQGAAERILDGISARLWLAVRSRLSSGR